MLVRTLTKLSLIFAILALIGLGSASHYTFPEESVTYSNSVEVTIQCDSSQGDCSDAYSDKYELRVCGQRAAIHRGNFGATSPTDSYTFNFKVPQNAACDYGSGHTFRFVPEPNNRDSSTQHVGTGGDLTVNNKGGGNPHVGKFKLFFGMNKGPKNMADFFITDEHLYNTPLTGPHIVFENYNTLMNDRAQATAKYGVPVGADDNDLSKVVDECTYGDSSACDMQNIDFTTEVSKNYHNSNYMDHVNIKPVHEYDGSYWPDGEFIYARFANYSVTSSTMAGTTTDPGARSTEGPNWYVCREGATVWNGEDYTGFVVDASETEDSEDLMKCEHDLDMAGNKYNFRWESVEECEDGLDNDGDSKIDYGDDPGCNSNTDTSEVGTNTCSDPNGCVDDEEQCTTGVTRDTVRETTLGVDYQGIVAQYNTTDGCSTDGTIYSTDDIVASNINEDPIYTECDQDQTYFGGICTKKSWDYNGFGHSVMPVVQYWPTWNYFYQMENADESLDLSEDVYETDFVSDYRGWTPKVQSLHEAEEMYSGDTVPPNYCGSDSACQDYSMWENRIREPEVSTAYDNDDSSTNIEAWYHGIEAGPFNAGVNVSSYTSQREVLSKDTSKEAIFKGGFAGKCESDQVWQKTQDSGNTWRCSGEIPWQQTVYLPEFQDNDNAGLIFPPYNFKNSQSDLPSYIFEETRDEGQIGAGWNSFETAAEQMDFLFTDSDVDHIDARCWEGTSNIDEDNPPSDVAVTDWFEIDVPSNPTDPVSNYMPLDHGGTYSCYWEVTTAGGETVPDIQDKMIEIHKHLGQSNPSGTTEVAVKNMTEDSSYADDLPDMTGSDHEWTASELDDKISSWN